MIKEILEKIVNSTDLVGKPLIKKSARNLVLSFAFLAPFVFSGCKDYHLSKITPSISNDGKRITYAEKTLGTSHIVVKEGWKNHKFNVGGPSFAYYPNLSSDNKLIYFENGHILYQIPFDVSKESSFFSDIPVKKTPLVPKIGSPENKDWIGLWHQYKNVFLGQKFDKTKARGRTIYIMNFDGNKYTAKPISQGYGDSPSLSTNGKYLVTSVLDRINNTSDLYLFLVNGNENPRRITNGKGIYSHPRFVFWPKDNENILFVTHTDSEYKNSRFELYNTKEMKITHKGRDLGNRINSPSLPRHGKKVIYSDNKKIRTYKLNKLRKVKYGK